MLGIAFDKAEDVLQASFVARRSPQIVVAALATCNWSRKVV